MGGDRLRCRGLRTCMAKSKSKSTKRTVKRFQAQLERMRSNLGWIIAYIPFDVAKVWETRGQLKVKGEINGFVFRGCLFPTREGRHFMLVNKEVQKGARAYENSVARFAIEADREVRSYEIPDELKAIFRQDRSLQKWHHALNASRRNDIAKWTSEPKSSVSRLRRAEQIAERMISVMEAERELPPILQVAFARDPLARVGWDGMSAACRRSHLFAIYYYRTPEARQRRIDKMLEDAAALAERRQGPRGD
jgi:hypothetical protein